MMDRPLFGVLFGSIQHVSSAWVANNAVFSAISGSVYESLYLFSGIVDSSLPFRLTTLSVPSNLPSVFEA